MIRRYLLKIMYNGKNYYGLVPQPGKPTVLSEIFKKIGKPLKYRVCSRTDKGVSAYENYIYLEYNQKKDFPEKVNKDIRILEVKELDEEIRFKDVVLEKTYIYIWKKEKPIYKPKYLNFNERKILIEKDKKEFDTNRIKRNLKYFLGKRNFRNFTIEKYKDYTCFIKNIFVKEVQDNIYFEFIGKRFLHQMVRRLVSFFISLGYGMIDENILKHITKPNYFLEPKPPASDPKKLILFKVKLKI